MKKKEKITQIEEEEDPEEDQESIISREDLIKDIGFNSVKTELKDVLKIILKRKNIDLLTRIKEIELDKICRMYYFGVKLTYYMNKTLLSKENIEKLLKLKSQDLEKYLQKYFIKSSLEDYVLTNLYLRLSLDSQSRNEIENITTNIIKKNIEEKKQEIQMNQNV